MVYVRVIIIANNKNRFFDKKYWNNTYSDTFQNLSFQTLNWNKKQIKTCKFFIKKELLMKSILCLLLFFTMVIGIAQTSDNCTAIYQWDDDNIVNTYAYNTAFNEVWGITQNGREYAIIGSTMGIHIIDVTDPENASLIHFVQGAFTGPEVVHRDFHDYNGYLYVVCDEGSSTLQIIDVSNLPESVETVYNSNDLLTTAHNVFIDEENAILYASGGSQELNLYSLEDPENPELIINCASQVSGWSQVGYVHDLYVKNGIAYCNAGDGLYIVDFNNTNSPSFLGSLTSYSDQGYNHSGWLNGDGTIYALADETVGTRIKILDVSDPTDITVLSLIGPTDFPQSIPHNVIFDGDLLHIAYYSDGYYLFDISDPENPVFIANYDTCGSIDCDFVDDGAWGVYPLLPSHNILVSDQKNGLFVLNISEVVSVDESKNELTWNLSNPVINETNTIELIGLAQADLEIKVRNALGQTIYNTISRNNNELTFQIPNLSSGIYFVILQTEKEEKTFKIIK